MIVKLLREAGFEEAILGLSLSFYDHAIPLEVFWNEQKQKRAIDRSLLLAHKDGGHNKFLESIQVWVFIQATRGFWQEFDTYRAGVSKQSASTMHTLDKRFVTKDDFSPNVKQVMIDAFNACIANYKDNQHPDYKNISVLKDNLPEGWLQERVVSTNYKVLRHIYLQRNNHRYKPWKVYIEQLLEQLEFPEFVKPDIDKPAR